MEHIKLDYPTKFTSSKLFIWHKILLTLLAMLHQDTSAVFHSSLSAKTMEGPRGKHCSQGQKKHMPSTLAHALEYFIGTQNMALLTDWLWQIVHTPSPSSDVIFIHYPIRHVGLKPSQAERRHSHYVEPAHTHARHIQ